MQLAKQFHHVLHQELWSSLVLHGIECSRLNKHHCLQDCSAVTTGGYRWQLA